MHEDLSQALPYVFRLCEAFNIPVLREPGWEADDVIGTLAKKAEVEGFADVHGHARQGLRPARFRAELYVQAGARRRRGRGFGGAGNSRPMAG